MASKNSIHRGLQFFSAGGNRQVDIKSGNELLALAGLDVNLWVAWACPADLPHMDRETLALMDSDGDGLIYAVDVIELLALLSEIIGRPEFFAKSAGFLSVADIDTSSEAGRRYAAGAARVLELLGRDVSDQMTVEDIDGLRATFDHQPCNGDGVITSASTEDPGLQGWISFLIGRYGATQDRSGQPGISLEQVLKHSSVVRSWHEWQDQGRTLQSLVQHEVDVLAVWQSVKTKIEDFFLRCQMAQFDQRAAILMNSPEQELVLLGAMNLVDATDSMAALPLSLVGEAASLPFDRGLNP